MNGFFPQYRPLLQRRPRRRQRRLEDKPDLQVFLAVAVTFQAVRSLAFGEVSLELILFLLIALQVSHMDKIAHGYSHVSISFFVERLPEVESDGVEKSLSRS